MPARAFLESAEARRLSGRAFRRRRKRLGARQGRGRARALAGRRPHSAVPGHVGQTTATGYL